MNLIIFTSALLSNIACNMLISFSNYLRAMKEEPLKVPFMFGKVIPEIFKKIPYHPLAIRYNLIAYFLIFGTTLADFYFNTWWSALLVFVIGRIIGSILTRLFIDRISYYNTILLSNLFLAIIFVVALVDHLNNA